MGPAWGHPWPSPVGPWPIPWLGPVPNHTALGAMVHGKVGGCVFPGVIANFVCNLQYSKVLWQRL